MNLVDHLWVTKVGLWLIGHGMDVSVMSNPPYDAVGTGHPRMGLV